MNIEAFLSRLASVKRSGCGWTARCPGHEDRHASLGIAAGNGGRILLKCYAGCETRQIVGAMGLTMKDLFPESDCTSTQCLRTPKVKQPTSRREKAVYPYTDSEGNTIFEVVRYEPKSFRQRRPDGRGGYIYNLSGVTRVLYNLPNVMEAIATERPIFAVEREKDVETLRKIGFTATCNAGGAGKWLDTYSECLQDADVIILPDNDAAGRKHARQVVESLRDKAATVRVLELPDLPEKGDVSDWLKNHTAEDFSASLLEATDAETWLKAYNGGKGTVSPEEEEDPPQYTHEQLKIGAECTEKRAAERFAEQFGTDHRYVPELGWMMWTGTRWELDISTQVSRKVTSLGRDWRDKAAEIVGRGGDWTTTAKPYATFAKKLESAKGVESVLVLSQPLCATALTDLDARPYLVNFSNCTLDFGTLADRQPARLKHQREHLLTKVIPRPYMPSASCPSWERFLVRIFPSEDLKRFIQQVVGYSLLGIVREQIFLICYGTGANGKSTFLNTLQECIGPDYANQADPSSFMVGREGQVRNDLADLRGIRFLAAIETGDGRRIDEALVKTMTGGEQIRARRLYHEAFQFKPEFTLWMATNHKPRITGSDNAIWRRVRLVPFTVTVPENERDRDLESKLLLEAPGILRWAVQGAVGYCTDGLLCPEEVRGATDDYRRAEDILGQFIEECTRSDKCDSVQASELHKAFLTHSGLTWSATMFGRRMGERGYERASRNGRNFYVGLSLNNDLFDTATGR